MRAKRTRREIAAYILNSSAFNVRVKDATKMILQGEGNDAVKEKHGRIVLEEATRNWKKYWDGIRVNTEGHAKMRV